MKAIRLPWNEYYRTNKDLWDKHVQNDILQFQDPYVEEIEIEPESELESEPEYDLEADSVELVTVASNRDLEER